MSPCRNFLCAALASLTLLASATGVLAQAPAGPGGPGGRGGAAAATPPGPPAPVPPAVAGPTAADAAAADRALARFIASDAEARTLTTKFPGLIEVRRPSAGPNTAIMPSLSNGFVAKHQANLAVAAQGDSELLFMGDSITDFWRNDTGAYAGKAVLDKYFGKWKVANFGIAGDTTQGVLYRLQNGEGKGFKPKAVMLMIGTNNTGRNSAAEIAEGIGAVVLELQKDFPDAKILLLGVFPRGRSTDAVRGTIAQINTIISRLHDGNRVQYLDIGAKFLDASGNIPAEVMSDGLHPSTKGYEIWADAVIAPITAMMTR